MRYRREVLAYIKENLENYSTMIRSETASTNDYFSRKMRSDRQDWAETTEIIATCCVYNINVHVLAIVQRSSVSCNWGGSPSSQPPHEKGRGQRPMSP